MKVLVIPSWHPTQEKPLFCTWILPHIEALKIAGHDIYVLHIDVDVTKDLKKLDEKVKIEQTEKKHLYSKLFVKYSKFYRTRFFYKQTLNSYTNRLFQMYEKMKESWGEPDVIHAHVSLCAGYGASILGKRYKIPVVVTEHYSGFENDAKYFWRVGHFVKEMGKKVQGFYAVSGGFAKRIENTKLLEVTGVLPNPVNTEIFYPKNEKTPSKTFRLISAGSASNIKGIDILFEALTILGNKIDWQIRLFGNFSNLKPYEKWLLNEEFKKRVIFEGKVPQEDLAKAYTNSDLYIVSSRSETANVSMLEAMACGIPVVTTACGGPESLVDDKVAIVVPSLNSKALSEAILKMYETKDSYKKDDLVDFISQNYSKEAVCKLMSKAYYDAINKI